MINAPFSFRMCLKQLLNFASESMFALIIGVSISAKSGVAPFYNELTVAKKYKWLSHNSGVQFKSGGSSKAHRNHLPHQSHV